MLGDKIKKQLGRLNNFYLIFAVAFLVWMSFFDNHNFYSQYLLNDKIEQLKQEKAYYTEEIINMQEENRALHESPHLLEKFAREKHRMKKTGEDVFIVVED